MSIGLVDTSVFCEILPVRGMDQHREQVLDTLARFIQAGVTLLLPVATILETGGHIAHIPDGRLRRSTAESFVERVQEALGNVGGPAPWTVPQPLLNPEALQSYLAEFADYAMREISLGDLSIIKEYDRQCLLHPYRHIFIWSLDRHLSAYDRPHTL